MIITQLRSSTSFLVIFVLWALLQCQPLRAEQTNTSPAQANETLTQKELRLRKVAIDFLNKQGQTDLKYVSIAKNVSYSPVQSGFDKSEMWNLSFANDKYTAQIVIPDDGSYIKSFLKESQHSDESETGDLISQDDAVKHATQVLIDAHLLTRFGMHFQSAMAWALVPQKKQWAMSWTRSYHGVQYYDELSTVMINAQTGELDSFGFVANIPQPTQFKEQIDQAKAQEIARQFFVSRDFLDWTQSRTTKFIVWPNAYWANKSSGATEAISIHPSPDGAIAWTSTFSKGATHYEAWVDASTGQIVGGELAVYEPRKPSSSQ